MDIFNTLAQLTIVVQVTSDIPGRINCIYLILPYQSGSHEGSWCTQSVPLNKEKQFLRRIKSNVNKEAEQIAKLREKKRRIYFRARYYSAELGRFISQDPLQYTDSTSLYPAFTNSPANYTDPRGTDILKGSTSEEMRKAAGYYRLEDPPENAEIRDPGLVESNPEVLPIELGSRLIDAENIYKEI